MQKGVILPLALLICGFFIILAVLWMFASINNLQHVKNQNTANSALGIAESGINYYLWHLSHNPTDYQDDTGTAGPYVHNYRDSSGKIIGQFTLDITAPASGSSTITVNSSGLLNN